MMTINLQPEGSESNQGSNLPSWGPVIVGGFSTAVGMWVIAFAIHIAAPGMPRAAMGAMLLVGQLVGAVAAGRQAKRMGKTPVLIGALAGLLATLLNMLVLGSILTETPAPGGESLVPNAATFVLGFVGLGVLIGAVGGFIGGLLAKAGSELATRQVWLARMGVVTCMAILPLLFIGGLVTSTGSGMAVPDWPTSYSANMFLYPLSHMTEQSDRFFEHSHRLFGSLVGLTTLTFMVLVLMFEPRRWVKWMAVGLFLAVCGQGLLGGGRVVLNKTVLAMIHGIGGQLILALSVATTACLAPAYVRAKATPSVPARLKTLATILIMCFVLQLSFGAALRHFPRSMHSAVSHVLFALVVMVLAMLMSFALTKLYAAAADGEKPSLKVLRVYGKALLHATSLQIVLGIAALWVLLVLAAEDPTKSTARAVVGTIHQFNGAVLLAIVTLSVVWVRRLAWANR